MPRKPLDIYFIMQAVIIFSLLMSLPDSLHGFAATRVLEFHAGAINKDIYLQTNLGLYYPAVQHLSNLPEGSRVQFMFQPWSYYCPATIACIPDPLFDNWSHPVMLGENPDALMQRWHQEIDYLLVYDSRTSPYSDDRFGYELWLQNHDFAVDANTQFPDALNEYLTPIWTDDFAYTLHEWKESD